MNWQLNSISDGGDMDFNGVPTQYRYGNSTLRSITFGIEREVTVYFSYEEPIAFKTPIGNFVRKLKVSKTTSKHINIVKSEFIKSSPFYGYTELDDDSFEDRWQRYVEEPLRRFHHLLKKVLHNEAVA